MATSGNIIKFGSISIHAMKHKASKPPFSKADKIPRTEAGYRVTDGNIAAIDFGTTSVSLAYTTKGDDKVSTLVMDTEDQSNRVPNAILLGKNERKMNVVSFGSFARKKFETIKSSEYSRYVYFERIKMLLKRDKVSNIMYKRMHDVIHSYRVLTDKH